MLNTQFLGRVTRPNMNRSLGEHIRFLEQLVQTLSDREMQNGLSVADRNKIESQLRAAEAILQHYRKALELEEQLIRA